LKNDIRGFLGEWEIISLEEERDEDENENSRVAQGNLNGLNF